MPWLTAAVARQNAVSWHLGRGMWLPAPSHFGSVPRATATGANTTGVGCLPRRHVRQSCYLHRRMQGWLPAPVAVLRQRRLVAAQVWWRRQPPTLRRPQQHTLACSHRWHPTPQSIWSNTGLARWPAAPTRHHAPCPPAVERHWQPLPRRHGSYQLRHTCVSTARRPQPHGQGQQGAAELQTMAACPPGYAPPHG